MTKKHFGLSASRWLLICGAIGLFGCISVVVTDIIGTLVVDGYNPIKQTISALAITEKSWIQDMGLNLFAASFVACGIGLLLLDFGRLEVESGLIYAVSFIC